MKLLICENKLQKSKESEARGITTEQEHTNKKGTHHSDNQVWI